MKKFGLCLGGGGARGLSHIAFIKVLDELKIKPTIISGSSMGAIIGAFYGAGMTGFEIEHIYTRSGCRNYDVCWILPF